MVNKTLLPKAYREVLKILEFIPKADYEKIPKYIIKNMEKEQDTNYQFVVTNFENFNKQEMLKETENILAVLYRDYWATEYERKIILTREHKERQELEKEKRMNYKPLNNIFQKEESMINTNLINTKEDAIQTIEVKQTWWSKIVNITKRILHIS